MVKAQLWDTAGQERYRSVASSYYRGALGAIIVYDVTYEKSFENLEYWIGQCHQHCPNAKILVCGNKIDMVEHRGESARVDATLHST